MVPFYQLEKHRTFAAKSVRKRVLTNAPTADEIRSLRQYLHKRRRLSKARKRAFTLHSACAFIDLLVQVNKHVVVNWAVCLVAG